MAANKMNTNPATPTIIEKTRIVKDRKNKILPTLFDFFIANETITAKKHNPVEITPNTINQSTNPDKSLLV